MEVPDVSYAQSGDVSIAYQVAGDGPAGAIACARAIVDRVRQFDLDVRAAIEDRGTHELKGIPGEWRLYAVSDA